MFGRSFLFDARHGLEAHIDMRYSNTVTSFARRAVQSYRLFCAEPPTLVLHIR